MAEPKNDALNREIRILWDHIPAARLKDKLDPIFVEQGIKLEVRQMRAHGAMSDPAVLVAVVSGAFAAMNAIILGLFKLLGKGYQKILIQLQDGRKLEIPANTSKKKLDEILDIMNQMEVRRLRVLDDKDNAEAPEINIYE